MEGIQVVISYLIILCLGIMLGWIFGRMKEREQQRKKRKIKELEEKFKYRIM